MPPTVWLHQRSPSTSSEEVPEVVAAAVARRIARIREAARFRRLAKTQRQLWLFYLEHNLFEAASDTRLAMLDHLRSAGHLWRLALGMTSR